MTIILFLVDTSSSMCQKAYVNGVQKTYLDIAKGAVETFLKFRQRTQDCLGDRYMLLTFEEPPANIKAGWKENHATFMNELKNLQSTGLTTMGESLKNAFDLLNLNRMQSGIDTYGQGRCPFYLEPSVIIVITDGGKYTYRNGVHPEIILPLSTQIPGTKFTKEPFRWDQRLFSLVLRMPGNKIEDPSGKVPHDDSPIERMCEVTGGRSYHVRSHVVLNQCLESLVQKVQPGVVLQFEPMLPKEGTTESQADIAFPTTKKMIYVQKHISQKTFPIGYWPLPEPYWPDPKAIILHPRDAHPKLKVVTTAVDEPQLVRSFPVDKYEIEACPMTFQILQKRDINKCWQVIISNGMHGFELPFGYLKASPNFTQVHLYVLAYNYPALLPLLHDLIHKYNMSPPNDLMYKFNAYVRSIPPYYSPFLRKVLHNLNVPYPLMQFMLPENIDNYLSPNIANQLKLIKNTAKQDQENLCLKVFKQLKLPKPPYRQVETAKLNTGVPLRRDLVRNPLLRDTFAKLHSELEPLENFTVIVPQLSRQSSAKSYRNPFDIPRRDLIEEIARMRETFLRPIPTSLVAKDSGHCLPISEMGNYQEYLKNKDNPLREIEPTNVRQHMFGNPYKKDKHMVMVDEADLSEVAPLKASGNTGAGTPNGMSVGGTNPNLLNLKKLDSRVRKRKAGPIRKDYIFRRIITDHSRSSSPMSTTSSVSSSSSHTSMGGFSMQNASQSYPSSPSSFSDYESDNMSDTSSVCSGMSDDHDPGRLVMSFDFNEEENTESDFPLNGYVRNFINDINTEENNAINNNHCHTDMAVSSLTLSNNSSMTTSNSNNSHINNSNPSNSSMVIGGQNMTNMNSSSSTHVLLAMNSNGNLTVPVVPTSPPSSPQHPYINSYSSPTAMISSIQQQEAYASVNQMVLAGNGVSNLPTTPAAPAVPSIYYTPQVHNQHMNNGSIYGGMSSMGVIPPLGPANLINSTPIIMYNQQQPILLQQPTPSTPATAITSTLQLQQPQTLPQPQHQPQLQHPPIVMTTVAPIVPIATITIATTTATAISTTSNATLSTTITTTTATTLPPTLGVQQQLPSVPQAHVVHNDINDAQEISRILQQCHNGTTSNNTNNNNNKNNDYHNTTIPTTAILGNTSTTPVPTNLDTELMPPPVVNNLEHLKSAYDNGNLFNNHTNIINYNNSNNNINNHNINNNNNNNNSNNRLTSLSNSMNHNANQQSETISTFNQQHSVKAKSPAPYTEDQRDAARKHNLEIRTLIFRDIRKPGRNYTQLLDHLNLVKGDYEIKSNFVDMCIYESMRFRRQQMMKSIESWWEIKKKTLLTNSTPSIHSAQIVDDS